MSIDYQKQKYVIDKIFDKYIRNISPYDKKLLPQLYEILDCPNKAYLDSQGYSKFQNIISEYVDLERGETKLNELYNMMDDMRYNDDIQEYLVKMIEYYCEQYFDKHELKNINN